MIAGADNYAAIHNLEVNGVDVVALRLAGHEDDTAVVGVHIHFGSKLGLRISNDNRGPGRAVRGFVDHRDVSPQALQGYISGAVEHLEGDIPVRLHADRTVHPGGTGHVDVALAVLRAGLDRSRHRGARPHLEVLGEQVAARYIDGNFGAGSQDRIVQDFVVMVRRCPILLANDDILAFLVMVDPDPANIIDQVLAFIVHFKAGTVLCIGVKVTCALEVGRGFIGFVENVTGAESTVAVPNPKILVISLTFNVADAVPDGVVVDVPSVIVLNALKDYALDGLRRGELFRHRSVFGNIKQQLPFTGRISTVEVIAVVADAEPYLLLVVADIAIGHRRAAVFRRLERRLNPFFTRIDIILSINVFCDVGCNLLQAQFGSFSFKRHRAGSASFAAGH